MSTCSNAEYKYPLTETPVTVGGFVDKPTEKPAVPPEAGLAGWLCAVGSTIGVFCTFGFLAAYAHPFKVFPLSYEELRSTLQNWRLSDSLRADVPEDIHSIDHIMDLHRPTFSHVDFRSCLWSCYGFIRSHASSRPMQHTMCLLAVHAESKY